MLTKLGIDWKLFIAQLINFMILFFVLRAVAWKPILEALENRRKKIAEGIENAELAEEKLESISLQKDKVITSARIEAKQIIEEAKQKAEKIREEKNQITKAEIEKQIEEAKKKIKNEKQESFQALQKELANLITEATGKIIKNLDSEKQNELVQEAIKDLSNT